MEKRNSYDCIIHDTAKIVTVFQKSPVDALAKIPSDVTIEKKRKGTDQIPDSVSRKEVRREARLLVVEDEPRMQRLLQSHLALNGWDVQVVGTAREALAIIADEDPALIRLVLLDIGLPDGDGLDVCRRVREWSNVPIILVTAADTPQLKVAALELGADDYLTKPFHTGELVARIRAVLRRVRAATDPDLPLTSVSLITVDDLTIDLSQRTVQSGDRPITLTKLEFDILREFVTHLDRVLTYSHLLHAVWGPGYEDIRVVHVHVSHLRRKLEPDVTGPRHLLTLPGVGYRFRSSIG